MLINRHLKVGILHSLIGKNDGVSIVIDQTVNAMTRQMNIDLGDIYFLAGHSSPRFNVQTDDVFWHKNEVHKAIVKGFCEPPSSNLEEMILENANHAKHVIKRFVEKNDIDLLIAHNTSHPYNFVTAVGLGLYLEELRSSGIIWPKVLVWWHDSFFERQEFSKPNPVISKYLKYLPSVNVDGIVFINSEQIELGRKYFASYDGRITEPFFQKRACIIPNTTEIEWEWQELDWDSDQLHYPPQDKYNETFFKDIGLEDEIARRGYTLNDAVLLLQHTRIVGRKKIELALDFAFMLDKKFKSENLDKCFVLLVSGHSGDEQTEYKRFLHEYYQQKLSQTPQANVILFFAEERILSHRESIVDKKYYKFAEVPSIVAAHGGIGTYFSDVEGFGNNLLEMMSQGLPVVMNKYNVYKKDIEPLGFDVISVENLHIRQQVVDEAFEVLTDIRRRNRMVRHNLAVLEEKLSHSLISERLSPLIQDIFTRIIK